MVRPPVAGYLKERATFGSCGGKVRVHVWCLSVETPRIIEDLGTALGAAHVTARMRSDHPDWSVADRLAPKGTSTRRGDFGEFLTAILYAGRIDESVPFQKLSTKPVSGATQQGTDVLNLTPLPKAMPQAAVVEVKTRASISPKADLDEIAESLGRVSDSYLRQSWQTAVQSMETHPAHRQAYALTAAISLASLTRPGEPGPAHERQAVIVTERATLKAAKIQEIWGTNPPVSELHLIEVPGYTTFIDDVYAYAASLSFADLDPAVPTYLSELGLTPGVDTAVSPDEPRRAAAAPDTAFSGVIEAALWYLAQWDGMGAARASQVALSPGTPEMKALGYLLNGSSKQASLLLPAESTLKPLPEACRLLWRHESDMKAFQEAVAAVVAAVEDEELAEAVRYTAAAVTHRYPRHPALVTAQAGATGTHVQGVLDYLATKARRALWPSQSHAIQGGLLDLDLDSLAVKMPTSAGKTLLIQLAVARSLDADDEGVAVVVAPTKALVRQLTQDLGDALPKGTGVRSSQGGLDYDDESSTGGLLGEPGVVVVTPERLDLEWRRAVTDVEGASVSKVRLLVVDEAHLISETKRGARLEMLIARAMRNKIRVLLLSSQFPTTQQLESWLGHSVIESDWGPTWLHRHVYHRSDDGRTGMVADETGLAAEVFPLRPSEKSKGQGVLRKRCNEAAALVVREQGEGLVVAFSRQRNWVEQLSSAVYEALVEVPGVHPELEEVIAPLKDSYPLYWESLRHGIGIHHSQVPLQVRRIVEYCARKRYLRCLVCTSTLLEGVDFPTKTVVCAYPPEERGVPQVARLRNLAGRAGRGGRFTSGTLIVMGETEADAQKWLKAFRAELPVTRSALERALQFLITSAKAVTGDSGDERQAALDALALEALAEGAVTDGELRRELEEILERTLWFTGPGAHAGVRDRVLGRATQLAQQVRSAFPTDQWSRVVYRTGLPLQSCLALRTAMEPHAQTLRFHIPDPQIDDVELLGWFVSKIAPEVPELIAEGWDGLDPDEMQAVVEGWVRGQPQAAIEAAYPKAWDKFAKAHESLLPWILTAAVEILTLLCRDVPTLGIVQLSPEYIHGKLAISRLRYGVPKGELCDLVRENADRVEVCRLASEFDALDSMTKLLSGGVSDYVRDHLKAEEVVSLEDEDEEPF